MNTEKKSITTADITLDLLRPYLPETDFRRAAAGARVSSLAYHLGRSYRFDVMTSTVKKKVRDVLNEAYEVGKVCRGYSGGAQRYALPSERLLDRARAERAARDADEAARAQLEADLDEERHTLALLALKGDATALLALLGK